MKYTLWLEFEQLREGNQWSKEKEYANIAVQFSDGRYYGINVWTYDFLQVAVAMDAVSHHHANGAYQIPPDLFVREMTRECIEKAIEDLLKKGNLERLLNPSIFGIHFLAPWIDALDLPNMGDAFKEELVKEIDQTHPLFGKTVQVVAKRQDTDDVLYWVEDDSSLVVVHLTWSSKKEVYPYPRTEVYKDKITFWQQRLQKDIEAFNS